MECGWYDRAHRPLILNQWHTVTQVCTCVQHMRLCRALHISKWTRQTTCYQHHGSLPSAGRELTDCEVSKQQQQQLLLENFTPRRLHLDSHDVLCERALRVVAQHVHSSLASWTFARVQIERRDWDLQSLWPASSDVHVNLLLLHCGHCLWDWTFPHVSRASSRLTSVQTNITKNAHMCLHTT